MDRDRVTFIVDGFNLYHSLRNAERDLDGATTKWLDLCSLCRSYLHLFGRQADLEEVYYFSALAKHLESDNPNVTRRHRTYIRCLKDTGVQVELNRFKKKRLKCPSCRSWFTKHEEKETDVAIAVQLLALLVEDRCDTAVVVSGDTDLAPAFKTAESLFPEKRVSFAFPYNRRNNELADMAPGSFGMSKGQYVKHQFDDPHELTDGTEVPKPSSW